MIIMVIFGFFFIVAAMLLAALVIGVIGIMYRAGRHFRESNAARRAAAARNSRTYVQKQP